MGALILAAVIGNSPFVIPPPPSHSASGYSASGACVTQPSGDVVCYDNDGVKGGQRNSDTAPQDLMLRPQVAYPGGTQTAANTNIFGGQDESKIAIDAFGSCVDDTTTVTVTVCDSNNSCTATVLRHDETDDEATDWQAGSNAIACSTLAAAVEALAGVGATCSSTTVLITLDGDTGSVSLAESTAACTTVSTGAAGYVSFPMGTTGSFNLQNDNMTTQTPTLRFQTDRVLVVTAPGGTTMTSFSVAGLRVGGTTVTQDVTLAGNGLTFAAGAAQNLTAGTFTDSATRGGTRVWTSRTWTNAMLAACAAGSTCELTVATAKAKTRITRALIVVTTAATHGSTLTMSFGTAADEDAYVLAGDIKAAANTVYGDADSEIGALLYSTSGDDHRIDDIPSWTGTTALSALLTAGAGDVNSVTGSTGSVYLEFEVLP